jgi:hypothetical protein
MNVEREAIRVLAERGWARFDAGICSDSTPLCLRGALWAANVRAGRPFTWQEAGANVESVIAEQFPEFVMDNGETSVIAFNDCTRTRIDDVILVLEKGAIRRDEQVSP